MVEIVLTVHLLIVLFCVVGFPVGLVWNLRLLRYLHAVILGFVSLFMVIGVSCPDPSTAPIAIPAAVLL